MPQPPLTFARSSRGRRLASAARMPHGDLLHLHVPQGRRHRSGVRSAASRGASSGFPSRRAPPIDPLPRRVPRASALLTGRAPAPAGPSSCSHRRLRRREGPALCRTSRTVATILVVDDDLDVAEGLQDLLVSEGHTVQTARTGEEGLRALRGAPLPDAILLDVDMPVLGGLGMAHQMMLHDAGEERIPIILCSGRQDLAGLAAKMGTPYSLAKPFDFHRLLALLGRVLCGRVAPRSA